MLTGFDSMRESASNIVTKSYLKVTRNFLSSCINFTSKTVLSMKLKITIFQFQTADSDIDGPVTTHRNELAIAE